MSGDDADLVLRDAGDEGEDGADSVRCLRRHPDRQLAADRIDLRHTTAGLDRSDVDARDVHVLLDDDVGVLERLVRRRGVARLPMEDAVALDFPIGA
jgi:hypothetical protein